MRALAIDFGGTLAGPGPGPDPDGALVATVLHNLPGTVIPQEFAATFDTAARRRRAHRAERVRTPLTDQLVHAAHACGAVIPDPGTATEAVFAALPDAVVDARAAAVVRRLHARGLRCVLACDTRRSEAMRRATLRAAGIEHCFCALVLSSAIGVRKPHPRFYATVVAKAGCAAREIVFVGDTPAKDAVGPHTHGMRAVLITAGPRPPELPAAIGVLGHIAELPDYLETLHA